MRHFTPSAFRVPSEVNNNPPIAECYFKPTDETLEILLWSQDKNRFHLVIKKKKAPTGPFGMMMYADVFIQASGISTDKYHQPMEKTFKRLLTQDILKIFNNNKHIYTRDL
jgi:hypothetical protein